MFDVMREEPEAGGSGGTSQAGNATQQGGGNDVEYFRAEAQKAFKARDALKQQLRELETSGRVLSDEKMQRLADLEKAAETAEEERKRKAGEFDSLRVQLTEKHQKELAEREKKIGALSERFKDTVVKAEFGAASEWFGGEGAKTILDVELGLAALGKYVRVEDADDDPRGYRVTVVDPRGHTIVGADGNPAPFALAVGELISALPNKDRILRGSGKTGSGSSGGSSSTSPTTDLVELTKRAQRGDKSAIDALRQQQGALGGIRLGTKKAS